MRTAREERGRRRLHTRRLSEPGQARGTGGGGCLRVDSCFLSTVFVISHLPATQALQGLRQAAQPQGLRL